MTHFSKQVRALIIQMERDGWISRYTKNGHWFGKSPCGAETATVGPDEGTRAYRNALARYNRWKKGQS